jgi:hypothetical protein
MGLPARQYTHQANLIAGLQGCRRRDQFAGADR